MDVLGQKTEVAYHVDRTDRFSGDRLAPWNRGKYPEISPNGPAEAGASCCTSMRTALPGGPRD